MLRQVKGGMNMTAIKTRASGTGVGKRKSRAKRPEKRTTRLSAGAKPPSGSRGGVSAGSGKSHAPLKVTYSVHPGVSMVQKWIEGLPGKTGRTLEQWIAFINKSGPKDEKACRAWLKDKHGIGTNTAWWLAERVHSKDMGLNEEDPEVYLANAARHVDEMYAGVRSAMRRIHDALIKLGLSMGGDVRVCPCKTIVPLYRNHVFAQIRPATNSRIDFGLALKDTKATGRLIDTGGFAKKDRISHRFAIASLDDINDDVRRWLKRAYDMDA